MPVYRFECPEGHVTEDLVGPATTDIVCEHLVYIYEGDPSMAAQPEMCGQRAVKIVQTSMGKPQGGPTPKFYPGRD